MHPSRAVEVLLVEDNPGDVRLAIEAFRETEAECRMQVAVDGVQALAYLHREGAYAEAARPDLILLDLNIPKKDGHEVLREIKADADLRRIPVVVLTMSRKEEDVARSYDLHANSYVMKPVELEEFLDVVKSIDSFWLRAVTLPER